MVDGKKGNKDKPGKRTKGAARELRIAAREDYRDMKEKGKQKTSEWSDYLSDNFQELKERGMQKGDELMHIIDDFIDQNPKKAAVIAAGIGAAIGAAIGSATSNMKNKSMSRSGRYDKRKNGYREDRNQEDF